jgi:hypothetical protein
MTAEASTKFPNPATITLTNPMVQKAILAFESEGGIKSLVKALTAAGQLEHSLLKDFNSATAAVKSLGVTDQAVHTQGIALSLSDVTTTPLVAHGLSTLHAAAT